MKKIGLLLICVCLVTCLASCQPEKKVENNDTNTDKPQIETEIDFSDFE